MTEMLSFIVKPKLNQSHKWCHMGSLCLSSSVSGTTGSHVHDKCKEIFSSVVRTQLLMQMYWNELLIPVLCIWHNPLASPIMIYK